MKNSNSKSNTATTATTTRTAMTLAPEDRSIPAPGNLLHTPSPAPLVPVSPPVSSSQAAALVDAKPLSPPARRKIRRNGHVARLPKHARDVVNRMLWNGIAYKNIVGAIGELGYTLTERNISNWATGGHLEWCLEQEAVLQTRLDQDHLIDFLRRDGAPELSEVGLQAAATHLSQVLLKKQIAWQKALKASLDPAKNGSQHPSPAASAPASAASEPVQKPATQPPPAPAPEAVR